MNSADKNKVIRRRLPVLKIIGILDHPLHIVRSKILLHGYVQRTIDIDRKKIFSNIVNHIARPKGMLQKGSQSITIEISIGIPGERNRVPGRRGASFTHTRTPARRILGRAGRQNPGQACPQSIGALWPGKIVTIFETLNFRTISRKQSDQFTTIGEGRIIFKFRDQEQPSGGKARSGWNCKIDSAPEMNSTQINRPIRNIGDFDKLSLPINRMIHDFRDNEIA